jgi:predicted RNase H-like nuclease
MGKNKQVECRICFKTMRSDTLKGHSKVHEKYKSKLIIQTNEEMCREIVMNLVDKVIEKNDTQTDTITVRNEDLSEEKRGLKRTTEVPHPTLPLQRF